MVEQRTLNSASQGSSPCPPARNSFNLPYVIEALEFLVSRGAVPREKVGPDQLRLKDEVASHHGGRVALQDHLKICRQIAIHVSLHHRVAGVVEFIAELSRTAEICRADEGEGLIGASGEVGVDQMEINHVTAGEIGDDVAEQRIGRAVRRGMKIERVCAISTGQQITPAASVKNVVAGAPAQDVRTVTAVEIIVARTPRKPVVSRAAEQAIIVTIADYDVRERIADNGKVCRALKSRHFPRQQGRPLSGRARSR